MLYQGGARTLALNLTMSTGKLYSVQSCQNIIDEWFKIYKGIKSWIDSAREDIAFKGYAETIFGRRLMVGQNPSEDQLRTGVNMIIQGSAVDILKQSLLRADKIWTQSPYPIRTVHHIHDEIIAQTKDKPECIKATMEGLNEAMYWHLGNVELTREIVAVRSFSKSEVPVAKF
jgi:DNA polymerase I-like protein with 3'-5' exonuclease and polymerase domains